MDPTGKTNPMQELAAGLRDLHRALAECARREYEREHRDLLSPGEFLHLLVNEPELAWIRSLSELLADLDVFLKADPSPTEDEAAAVRDEVERLIAAPEPQEALDAFGEFARRHRACAGNDSHVAVAHERIRQALQGLPEAASVNEAVVLHGRPWWAEIRRHRR